MGQCKFCTILLAGTLMFGYPAEPVTAASVVSVSAPAILESRPDTSALDRKVLILESDSMDEDLNNGFLTNVDISDVETGVETFDKKTLYHTYDKNSSPDDHMPAEIQVNGDTYVLLDAEQPVLISQKEVIPKSLSYKSEVFTGDGSEYEPEMIRKDENGSTYRLVSKELNEQEAPARSEYKELPVTYTAMEAGVQILDRKATEIEDVDTGQKIQAVLDLKSEKVIRGYWLDDFEFPITVTGYDADVFMLNETRIPKDANLTDYADEFLQYLKLDATAYRISSIDWEGDSYQEDGELVRNAVARGSKYVKDIEATYSGEVELPAIIGKTWSCVYEEEVPKDRQVIYTMAANVTYQLKNAAVVEKSLPEKIIDKMNGIIAAAYEAVVTAFEEHPVISSIPLVLLAALLAFLITKKYKNLCIYDDIKCPYKKHNKELCRTCVNYHRRNQI